MSSIRTPQIATQHGALDSSAVAPDGAFSAHQIREIARNANRYVTKRRVVISSWWPVHDTADHGEGAGVWHFSGGFAPPTWALVGTWPVAKLENHRMLDLRATVRVTNGQKVDLQIVTRAARFSVTPVGSRLVQVSGSGAFDDVDFDAVPLVGGVSDDVELWVRAATQGALLNTTLYGTPDTLTGPGVQEDRVGDAAGNWTAPPSRTMAEAGHAAYFLDADGYTLAVREVAAVQSPQNDTLILTPRFSRREIATVVAQVDTVEIRKLPDVDLTAFVGVSYAV